MFFAILFLIFSETSATQEFMRLSPFKRAEFCKETAKSLKPGKEVFDYLFANDIPSSKLDEIRNYLEIKGIKPPSPSGWFAPPRVIISINEIRKNTKNKKNTLDILLAAPYFSDESKNKAFEKIIKKGCMIRGLFAQQDAEMPKILLNLAFHRTTMFFRDEITSALREAGSSVVLSFLPLTRQRVSKERNPLKYYKKRYASYILSSSVFGTPRLALQNADKSLKIRLIRLYGKYHEPQAIYPLLTYAENAENEIKTAARQAILEFFKAKLKNKVGIIKKHGGVEVKSIISLSPRVQAYHAVKKTLEKVTRGDYDRTLHGSSLAKALFAFWDKKKNEKWKDEFIAAYSLYKEGHVFSAVTKYMNILANSPDIPRKELMFPAFVDVAKLKLKQKNVQETLKYLYFANQVKKDNRILSEINYLKGLIEEASGNKLQALHKYKTALRLNPGNVWAKAAFADLNPVQNAEALSLEKSVILIILLLGFLLFIIYILFTKPYDHV